MNPPEFPEIPLVGQRSKVLSWYPTAVVGCYCQGPDRFAMLILTGFENWVACGRCGYLYAIERILEDGHTVTIKFLPPMAKKDIM